VAAIDLDTRGDRGTTAAVGPYFEHPDQLVRPVSPVTQVTRGAGVISTAQAGDLEATLMGGLVSGADVEAMGSSSRLRVSTYGGGPYHDGDVWTLNVSAAQGVLLTSDYRFDCSPYFFILSINVTRDTPSRRAASL
jgi:hypothetical protein